MGEALMLLVGVLGTAVRFHNMTRLAGPPGSGRLDYLSPGGA